jgi:hypothetical protein
MKIQTRTLLENVIRKNLGNPGYCDEFWEMTKKHNPWKQLIN